MFVPYMDADYGWYSRTYFDTGEYGAGILRLAAQGGVDCPATASFLPAVFSNDKGEPLTTPNAMCVFERSGGDPVWRHFEGINQTYEGRAGVELVVRMAAAIGNYDYLIDWVFTDAGRDRGPRRRHRHRRAQGRAVTAHDRPDRRRRHAIRHAGGAEPGGGQPRPLLQLPARPRRRRPGQQLQPGRLSPDQLPDDSPRRSIYVVEPRIAATEAAAQLDTHAGPAKMRVVNEGRTNAVGNPVSYEVLAANHARLLLDPQDWPARRASFLQHDLWVTPYEPAERYAGGRVRPGQPRRRRAGGMDRARPPDPEPGHRGLGQHRHAPSDAGRGPAGDADDLALVPAAAAQLLQPQPGDRPEKDWSLE